MKVNYAKQDIEWFNNNRTVENYTHLLNKYNVYPLRRKCVCCGGEIFYTNVQLSSSHDTISLYRGYSHLTTRKMYDGSEYPLLICEKCLASKFPEYNDYPSKSKIFMNYTKYTKFAFNIPDDVFKKQSKEKNGNSLDKFIKKYGKEEGEKRWNKYCKKLALTKDKFIQTYGKEEGEKRWNSYREKQAYTNTFEYKQEKYGWTRKEFDEYNKSRAATLENMINRYGEKDGLEKWNNYIINQRYTNTREYFIKQYGETAGLKKWNNFNTARMINNSYSAISQELFRLLIENDLFNNHEIFFAEYNYEYEIMSSNKSLYYLDFYDKTLNICVEFNGEAFHPNPSKYKATDIFYSPFDDYGKSVEDLWNNEQKRYHTLKTEFGIDTIVVWEKEFRQNKMSVIEYIINEINKILKLRK